MKNWHSLPPTESKLKYNIVRMADCTVDKTATLPINATLYLKVKRDADIC